MLPSPEISYRIVANPQAADIVIVSTDAQGNQGSLNQYVRKELGYNEKERPKGADLVKGYSMFQSSKSKPILYIVTVGGLTVLENLRRNLTNALEAHSEELSEKKIWMPLMGTGAGGLALLDSFDIIMEVLHEVHTNDLYAKFLISVPENIDRKSLEEIQARIPEAPSELEEVEEGNDEEKPDLSVLLNRLSSSSQSALEFANGARNQTDQPEIQMEHLILGLYVAKDGITRQFFEANDVDEEVLVKTIGVITGSLLVESIDPYPESKMVFSTDVQEALKSANKRSTDQGHKQIRSRDLLFGTLSLQKNTIIEGLKDAFGADLDKLRKYLENEDLTSEPETELTSGRSYRHVTASKMPAAIEVDLLAEEMARFLHTLKGESAMLIGLFGRWGRGKTFLFNRIWRFLAEDERFKGHYFRVDFHAWKHQETPASWGYLYEAIANEYYKQATSWWDKQLRVLRLNWVREPKGELISFVTGLIGSTIAIYGLLESNSDWLYALFPSMALVLGSVGSKALKLWKERSSRAKQLYKKYTEKQSFLELLGTQAEVQGELKTLLTTWIKPSDYSTEEEVIFDNRVLLFVDDIDRCSESRIIQVIDALRVMLEDQDIARRILVVVAVDERILRRAIRLKYEKLLADLEGDEKERKLGLLTREYLDKLFLSGIKLGDLTERERKGIFGALTDKKVQERPVEPQHPGEDNEGRSPSSSGTQTPDPKPNKTADPHTDQPGSEKESSQDGRTGENTDRAAMGSGKQDDMEEPEFEISYQEHKQLEDALKKLDEITPRQIRIFYLRYLLGRDFLKTLKKRHTWNKEQSNALIEVLTFLYNKELFDVSVEKLLVSENFNEKNWANLDEKERKLFLEVLDVIVPY